jgi:hypothetical protein
MVKKMNQCSAEIGRGQIFDNSKYSLTLLILMFPSLLMAITTAIVSNVFGRLGLQILLLVFQFILVKNVLDEYYLIDKE